MRAYPGSAGKRPQIHHRRRIASHPGRGLVITSKGILVERINRARGTGNINRPVNLRAVEIDDAPVVIVQREAQVAGGIHRARDGERTAGIEGDVAGGARQDPQHVSQNGRVVTIAKAKSAGPGEP